MSDIRTSALGGVPFGTSSTRPANPQIGRTYYNGTLGVQEIYTSSGWLTATGANDFNVTLNRSVTTATFTKEYFAGAYTISSALLDSTYDIYVYDTSGNNVGYTKTPSLNATGNFNKIVVVGGSTGDLLSFSYKTTFTATNTTAQITAGAFITSASHTALNNINDTTTIVGGNFSSNVAVYFVGSDNIERAAKSIVRSSDSQLIVTRPDDFPTTLGTYKLVVENPGVTRPTGSSLHILNNAITAGTIPSWSTGEVLPRVIKNTSYSTSVSATDVESSSITYSLSGGSLPSGLSLSSSGLISGTHTGSDFNSSITVRATDAGGNFSDRVFTIFQNSLFDTLSSNLRIYLDAESLGSTGQWLDLTGNSNSFSQQGTRTPVVTKSGVPAIRFNGSGYWMTSSIPNNLILDGSTISFWLYTPGAIPVRSGLFEQRNNNGASYTGALAITYETNGEITFYRYNPYQSYASGTLNSSKWVHVTLVLTGGALSGTSPQIKLYIDGVLNSTTNTNSSSDKNISNLGPLVIGNGYTQTLTDGWLSAFRAWNTELNQSQILSDYNNTKSRYGL